MPVMTALARLLSTIRLSSHHFVRPGRHASLIRPTSSTFSHPISLVGPITWHGAALAQCMLIKVSLKNTKLILFKVLRNNKFYF